jgi:hypothetical protein
MPRPQFRLRSLFMLTALVAVGCLVGPPIVREVRARFWPPEPPEQPYMIIGNGGGYTYYYGSGRVVHEWKPLDDSAAH